MEGFDLKANEAQRLHLCQRANQATLVIDTLNELIEDQSLPEAVRDAAGHAALKMGAARRVLNEALMAARAACSDGADIGPTRPPPPPPPPSSAAAEQEPS